MKLIHKIFYIIIAVGMCGTLAGLPVATVPTEIRYTPTTIPVNEELLPVLSVISNAVLSVERILKSQNYTIHKFGRDLWLVAEDKDQSTVWRIFPYYTNAIVGSVEAIVYQDNAMTQKDQTRSFRMSFYPETGALRDFWWADGHEVLFVQTNSTSNYGRDLGGKMGLEMRWDDKGDLVSSNVYNWAKRGQPIGGIKPAILEARVTLKPEALEVSPGILTAFVRFPDGYPVTNIVSATCDGARAERMMLNDDGTEMIIKFRRRDIEEALAKIGESIDTNFVVRGTWQDKAGYHHRFQGAASITKIVGAKEKKK